MTLRVAVTAPILLPGTCSPESRLFSGFLNYRICIIIDNSFTIYESAYLHAPFPLSLEGKRMIIARKALIFLILMLIMFLSSCTRQYSSTDVVAFTNINTHLTEEDIKEGNRRTHAQMPAVRLSHFKHEDAGVECIVCHHKHDNPSRLKKCNYCHKGIRGVEDMHEYCIGCHENRGGPEDCESCHPVSGQDIDTDTHRDYDPDKIFTDRYHDYHQAVNCQTCHHKAESTEEMKNCSLCHSGDVPRMRIMHFFCRDCHMKNEKGPVTCTDCHK